jgi:hypothetical protein
MKATPFGKRPYWMLCLGLFAFGCGGHGVKVTLDAGGDEVVVTQDANGKQYDPSDVAGKDMFAAADAGVATLADAARDAVGIDAVIGPEAGAGDALWSSVVGSCATTQLLSYPKHCRTVADCGPTGPVVCSLGQYDWGPAACPIPPSMQPCPRECSADKDCTASTGGTCETFTRACPNCNGKVCHYPPPPCTASPNSCGTTQRCRTDGTCEAIPCNEGNACATNFRCSGGSAKADKRGCEPIPCTEGTPCSSGRRCNLGSARADVFGCELIPCDAGFTCPADTRCNVGSPRADSKGCEYVPCNAGYACPEDTRCTVASPPANDHGCTTMSCKSDGDCDCGFCMDGVCSANPGTCQYPPV